MCKENVEEWVIQFPEFTTNFPSLQRVIDKTENAQRNNPEKQLCNNLDDTYARSTIRPDCHVCSGDQKILGCV